eukprot:Seg2074.5 transcript_id=Seg2074.5/GoldUCD/mRNA.D3Y31 product="PDZ domain-containing protein GIPC1" protein_id=Seg2074.5/GoldUCD/D3Y31
MPLFSKKEKITSQSKKDSKNKSKENGAKTSPEEDVSKKKASSPTATPSQQQATRQAEPFPADNQHNAEAQQLAKRLIFHAQLAHGSPTGKIENFSNVKELYQRIANEFSISPSEIIFCTLNSPKVNMEKLLGGQIGLDDLIFAHVKGETKELSAIKDGPALGLTITDNGAGIPFVKRIREGSVMEKYSEVKVGDHIAMINDKSYVGCRHFEVAKVLREIEEGAQFTIKLVEPKKAFEGIAPRQSKGSSSTNSSMVGSGKATLRLRSKGPATVEEQPQWEAVAIKRIDDLLESFLGIRDPELANTLIDLGKNIENPSEYASAVEGQLGDFGFPDDFIFDLWGAIGDAKAGRI